MSNKMKNTKSVVIMGLFIAMSVVGGYIKLPNPVTSSIALDSFPAFAASLLLGGGPGAVIGFFGHMVSAAIGGFPMTLPIHLLIGAQMAIIMFCFKQIRDKLGRVAAAICGVIMNGLIAPACFIVIPGYGKAVFLQLIIPLVAASVINIAAALMVTSALGTRKAFKGYLEE
jgi:uncharacterized membrane protein